MIHDKAREKAAIITAKTTRWSVFGSLMSHL
jgi:hypothetical protein